MKQLTLNLMFVLLGLCLWSLQPVYAQEAPQDTTKEGYPIYKNVDVNIEYAWTDMERYENVDAIIKMEGKKAVAVIAVMPDGTKYEVILMDGVTVKLYDHQTGKLIRVFGNPRAT